jgi:hypothetical protein
MSKWDFLLGKDLQIILCSRCKTPIRQAEAFGWDNAQTFYCEKCTVELDLKRFEGKENKKCRISKKRCGKQALS